MQVKLWTVALFVVASCQVAQCFLSPLRYGAAKVAQIKKSTVTSRTNGLFDKDIPSAFRTGVPHSFNFQLRACDGTSALFIERSDRKTSELIQEIKNLKSGSQEVVRTIGVLIGLVVMYFNIKMLQGNGDALLAVLLYFVLMLPTLSLILFTY